MAKEIGAFEKQGLESGSRLYQLRERHCSSDGGWEFGYEHRGKQRGGELDSPGAHLWLLWAALPTVRR